MDTSLSYTDRDFAYFSSDEPKWHRRIMALKKEYPDQVSIEYEPEKNDGCICAKVPTAWFKISPPRKVNYTDEQRAEMAARMKRIRNET